MFILELNDEYKLYRIVKDNKPTQLAMTYKSLSYDNTGIKGDFSIDRIYFSPEANCSTYVYKNRIMSNVINYVEIKYNVRHLQEFYDKFKGIKIKSSFTNAQEIFDFLNQDSKII
jgi:hypothetical protein